MSKCTVCKSGGSIHYGWVGKTCQSAHCVSQGFHSLWLGWENMSKCTLCKSGVPFIIVGLGKHVKVYTV